MDLRDFPQTRSLDLIDAFLPLPPPLLSFSLSLFTYRHLYLSYSALYILSFFTYLPA